ncbi:MAG: thioredoxin domain-containing protein [Bacteroidota bacterium]
MPNRLIDQTSPYLLQHAHNPVDWYPWGEEALHRATTENKPIIVSIGYAACHWCHVMERESFEDEEVAQLMNQHFVCIKVDREERPDIDKIYMDAVMVMTGQGGWPLNAIALPDGRPIYGGTYFRKDQWMRALGQVAGLYQQQPEQTEQYAVDLVNAMKRMDVLQPTDSKPFAQSDLQRISLQWMPQIDRKWGGRDVKANKFPLPANNIFLLRAAQLKQDEEIQAAVDITLEKMAFGGIYDHLGGGFARYSVDPYWKVPHFEKMLYDNGQLVSLYAEAYLQKPQALYKRLVFQTIDFLERELTSEEGGFYSSLDADSEGEEGKFYVWTYDEIEQLLGEDARLFGDYYNAHPFGNWEGNNILFVLETEEEFAKRWKLDVEEFKAKMQAGREILFQAREPRVRPGLDDKILTSWNALMLRGLVDAYLTFGEDRILQMAVKNAHFLRDKLTEGPRLFRNYKNGQRSISAFLDDYANLIDAYVSLYQATFEVQWLRQAELHVHHVLAHFSDPETDLFFYTSDEDPVLVRRKTERQDDVIPSSNSVLAKSLHTLGLILHKSDYLDRSLRMLQSMKTDLIQNPAWHANWGQLMLRHIYPHYEVAITGAEAGAFRQELIQQYHPNRIFAGGQEGDEIPILAQRFVKETTIYVCEGNRCQLPVTEVEKAVEMMGG